MFRKGILIILIVLTLHILNICILPSGKASPNNTTSGRTTPPHPLSSQ